MKHNELLPAPIYFMAKVSSLQGIGSMEILLEIVTTTSQEGCTHRLADVGNRVHTRNDSDEDVRGNACKQTIAWKALPWSFNYVAHGYQIFRI